jgi:hypothetical protein
MKRNIFLLVVLLFCQTLFAQVMTPEEQKLFQLINYKRLRHNLDTIPFSTKLTYVAQTHVRDLNDYPPTGPCNLHSWSSHGNWEPCCYYSDHRNAELMWSKPKELIDYCSPGYEISAATGGEMTAATALSLWQSSLGHYNVIFNVGMWRDIKFQAMGVGIYKNYAVVWFGEILDKSE